jgi:hypothetical protein
MKIELETGEKKKKVIHATLTTIIPYASLVCEGNAGTL